MQTKEETNLKRLINNMPTASVRLCEVNGSVVNEAPPAILPITDHDVIVGTNEHGTLGTCNLLNPTSPVSPGFAPAGVTGLRRLHHESEKQEHIRLVARMLIDLIKNGVDALALQEVPAQTTPYFKDFLLHLKQFAQEENIELDFDAFHESIATTKKPLRDNKDQGYHDFATAFLMKKGAFTLDNKTLLSDERGATYSLTSAKSGKNLRVINLHGYYGHANIHAKDILKALNDSNTIVLGDTNIPLSNKEAVADMASLSGVVVEPSSNIEGTADSSRTLDCFVTNIQTDYIFKEGCKNIATYVSKKNYEPTLFGDTAKIVKPGVVNNSTFNMTF
jgi:hypothetical protein